MSDLTIHRRLTKPGLTDQVDILDINGNMDKLDLIKDQAAITVGHATYITKRPFQVDYICDGVEDNVQIQAAIDIVDSYGGGTVRILPGTYVIHNEIVPKTNVRIEMESGAIIQIMSQLRTALTSDLDWNEYTFTVVDATGFKAGMRIGWTIGSDTGYVVGYIGTIDTVVGNTVTVLNEPTKRTTGQNLTVSGGAHLISYFSAIHAESVDGWGIAGGIIDGNKVNCLVYLQNKDQDMNGIIFGSCRNILIDHVEVKNTLFQGIHVCGRIAQGVVLNKCYVHDCSSSGICLDSIDEIVTVIDCISVDNSPAGLQLIDVAYASVIGGYYVNNGVWNIRLGFVETMSHNRISGAYVEGVIGISLLNCLGTVVSGCIAKDCTVGLKLDAEDGYFSTHNLISDCVFDGCAIGIEEVATCIYNDIKNPKFIDCATKLSLAGTSTTYTYSDGGNNYLSGLTEMTYLKLLATSNALQFGTQFHFEIIGGNIFKIVQTGVAERLEVGSELKMNSHHVPEITPHTSDPTVTDDIDLGYRSGDTWINTSGQKVWVCISNADGAAVWKQTG